MPHAIDLDMIKVIRKASIDFKREAKNAPAQLEKINKANYISVEYGVSSQLFFEWRVL